jgi:hypothetical protein
VRNSNKNGLPVHLEEGSVKQMASSVLSMAQLAATALAEHGTAGSHSMAQLAATALAEHGTVGSHSSCALLMHTQQLPSHALWPLLSAEGNCWQWLQSAAGAAVS